MHPRLIGHRVHISSALLLVLGSTLIAMPGHAEVGLRVESRPLTAPIDAYVRVMEGGKPVAGLTPADFAVRLDGAPVDFTLTLPPKQDSTQKVSAVLIIREESDGPHFPTPVPPMFSNFVGRLGIGDFVSVVKVWHDLEYFDRGGLSVLPFTELDDGPGTEQVISFIQENPVSGYQGRARYLYDGLMAALSEFETGSATLPDGPKAIVTLDCCGGRGISLSDVIATANTGGIALFDMTYAGWARYRDLIASMKALARYTGGVHVELADDAPPRDALRTMSSWLNHGYRVSIPESAISDCDWHRLAVTVGGESTAVTFSRCDSTPEPFTFTDRLDAPVAKRIRSNPVTITGIDTAVPIRVYGGEYSIGCNTTFTSESGRILPGESVCVRHTTAASGGLEVSTLLIVGGESDWFESSTVFP
jgi:hypothetical protein